MKHDDEFSATERALLALWRAPRPSADLADRVVERTGLEAPSSRLARRGWVAAAVVAVAIGAAFTSRMVTRQPGFLPPAMQLAGPDGGAPFEVRPPTVDTRS